MKKPNPPTIAAMKRDYPICVKNLQTLMKMGFSCVATFWSLAVLLTMAACGLAYEVYSLSEPVLPFHLAEVGLLTLWAYFQRKFYRSYTAAIVSLGRMTEKTILAKRYIELRVLKKFSDNAAVEQAFDDLKNKRWKEMQEVAWELMPTSRQTP